ncbi:Polysaccharide deacetylase [Labilithrix luteola]|uniref:Polysaccharide deacetylase n=1 Tax=Labilithrix luteola TaxID=1391654 RepID=A0A0K1PY31_9BACT|nr:polysaccharide deacetylase family protein [Labilithrix luteola]AKU98438.1 Polysaccharide deacetylase [Labilithrix luteola]
MNRRGLATSVASRAGLLQLLERAGARPALAVLVYHRVLSPDGHRYDKAVIEATPEEFDEQMGMLKRRHSVVTADELTDVILNPTKLRHFRVAVTFDDGYRDNYDHAFPILKSHGLSATFFVSTHYMDSRRLSWWDQVAYVIRKSRRSTLKLEYPKRVAVEVDRDAPDLAIQTILRLYTRSNADLSCFLAAVEEACELRVPDEAEDRQFMSWQEAQEMKDAGMSIGSHTHSHGILAAMTAEQQRAECRESREQLKARNLTSDVLAYPVGSVTTFSATTIRCAKDEGYRIAFSNYGGVNRPDAMNPFDVKRMNMNIDETARQLRFRLALSRVSRRAAW